MVRRVTLSGTVLLTAVMLLLAGVRGLVWAQGGGGCPAGDTNYYPDCDVSQDGQINIEDLQRVAARWKVNSPTGTWAGHFGDTWSGSGPFGLKVQIPDWFEALNQDFRYQLTAIGAAMPGLYIAQEVQDNRFRIAGGVPGAKVSWQVTGIRHDPFAEQNRIPVEEEKPAGEKGTYLYPAGYGQPESKGLDYQRRRQLFQQHDLQAEPAATPPR